MLAGFLVLPAAAQPSIASGSASADGAAAGARASADDTTARQLQGLWKGEVSYAPNAPGGPPGTLRINLKFDGCSSAQTCTARVLTREPVNDMAESGPMPVTFVPAERLVTFDQKEGPARHGAKDACPRSFLDHGSTWKLYVLDSGGLLLATVWTHPPDHESRQCAQVTLKRCPAGPCD